MQHPGIARRLFAFTHCYYPSGSAHIHLFTFRTMYECELSRERSAVQYSSESGPPLHCERLLLAVSNRLVGEYISLQKSPCFPPHQTPRFESTTEIFNHSRDQHISTTFQLFSYRTTST